MNNRLQEKQDVQLHLVNKLKLCALPIWKGTKLPAFRAKAQREDKRHWTEIVDSDQGKLYDMERFDLGIKGSRLDDDNGKPTYFMWFDVDFHEPNDLVLFAEKIKPRLEKKGFLVTQSPSGGYHYGLRTTEDPTSTAKVFEYPDSGITVDFRASHTQCVVIDSDGRYNIVEMPETLIYMDFGVFRQLFTQLGFVQPKPVKSRMDGQLREFVRQYLDGENKPDDIDTNLWMLGIIRYLMGIHGDHADPIMNDAKEALKLCGDTAKDESWLLNKVEDCLINQKPLNLNRGGKGSKKVESFEIARIILEKTKLYKDAGTRKLYAVEKGFLEDVTVSIEASIAKEWESDINDTKQIIHALIALAENVPDTDSDNIRFKNGMFDTVTNTFDNNPDDRVCLVGYPEYDYKEDADPVLLKSLIDNQIEDYSRNNLYAWLKKMPTASKEIRMAVFYGKPGTGKSALAAGLEMALGDKGYGLTMTDFFKDRATQAQIVGRTMLYFQDTPKKWSDIDRLKQTTGEYRLNIRGMYQDSEITKNMLNIAVSTNSLTKIDADDEEAMFDRLTLIKFKDNKIRDTSADDEDFPLKLASEGEDIISYCLNLRKESHKFDDSATTRKLWKQISCPEIRALEATFQYEDGAQGFAIQQVKSIMDTKFPDQEFEISDLKNGLETLGYGLSKGKYANLKQILISNGQETLV